MKVKQLTIFLTLMIMVTIFSGCDGKPSMSTYEEPVLSELRTLFVRCRDGDLQVPNLHEGSEALFRTEFTTGNVNLDFEVNVIVDSMAIPGGSSVAVTQIYAPVVVRKEPGTAKGTIRVDVMLMAPCKSAGCYILTVAVKDSKGGTTSMHYDLQSTVSSFFPSSGPCYCTTQCSECGTIYSRYHCNCMIGNEPQVMAQWIQDNPGEVVPYW